MSIIWNTILVSMAAAFLVSFANVVIGKHFYMWPNKEIRLWGPIALSLPGLWLAGVPWSQIAIPTLAVCFLTNLLLIIVDRLNTVVVRR